MVREHYLKGLVRHCKSLVNFTVVIVRPNASDNYDSSSCIVMENVREIYITKIIQIMR